MKLSSKKHLGVFTSVLAVLLFAISTLLYFVVQWLIRTWPNLKMDELNVTAAETKATYEEIREYVKEHTGLNVSNLYIAQVKRKCGIKERQNYNKPKAENPKQLKCPTEKEKAIREALKHFKMI